MSIEETRAQFEAWAKDQCRYVLERAVHRTDRYYWSDTQGAWEAWQAANAAEITRLRAELDNAAAAAVANMSLACEKEREADALRVDAERYRWIRQLDNAFDYRAIARQWDSSHTPEQLDRTIDAAMGADV